MTISLYLTNNAGTVEISQLVQSITWSGDVEECARTLEFEMVSSSLDKNLPEVDCSLGNSVTFMQDNRVLFFGYVFQRQKDTGSGIIRITCYDRGIYLNRNESSYKFTNMTPEAIAKRVCGDFGIETALIAETGMKLTRNFIGSNLYNVIKTCYDLAAVQTGEDYILRFEGQKLNVLKKAVTEETLVIEGGSNLMSASVSESIDNMITQVAIYDSSDKLVNTRRDEERTKLYGLMQSYLEQTDGEDADKSAAKLIENNGVSQKITLNNLGNIANLSGAAVVVREPYTGLYGLFYIDSDIHTWKRGQYYNKLVVSFRRIMEKQEIQSLPNAGGKETSPSKTGTTRKRTSYLIIKGDGTVGRKSVFSSVEEYTQ